MGEGNIAGAMETGMKESGVRDSERAGELHLEGEENTYTGTWEKGVKHGEGKFTYHGGDVFTGPYVDGNRHGTGELVKTDGEVRTEIYKEGKLINFTVTKEKKA